MHAFMATEGKQTRNAWHKPVACRGNPSSSTPYSVEQTNKVSEFYGRLIFLEQSRSGEGDKAGSMHSRRKSGFEASRPASDVASLFAGVTSILTLTWVRAW